MPSKARMPYGKFKGDLVGDLPASYIASLLDHDTERTIDPLLARALALELFERVVLGRIEVDLTQHVGKTRRPASDPHGVFDEPTRPRASFRPADDMRPTPPPSGRDVDPELARQVVDAGYRVVAAKVHPDVGGSPEQFHRLTRTVEALRTILPARRA